LFRAVVDGVPQRVRVLVRKLGPGH
jgi:hypothetical protein